MRVCAYGAAVIYHPCIVRLLEGDRQLEQLAVAFQEEPRDLHRRRGLHSAPTSSAWTQDKELGGRELTLAKKRSPSSREPMAASGTSTTTFTFLARVSAMLCSQPYVSVRYERLILSWGAVMRCIASEPIKSKGHCR